MTQHVPVLLNEVIDLLNLKPGDNVIDATVGGGGHAEAILERTAPDGRLLGIDADRDAIERTTVRLQRFGKRVTLVEGNFRKIGEIRRKQFPYPVHAALFDLGLSSDQLADASRGFSFVSDGPLNMRFGGKGDASAFSAMELVNTSPEAELARIIRQYGEERYAKAIAHSIAVSRRKSPIETTQALVSCILSAVPHARRPALSKLRTTFDAKWSHDHRRMKFGTYGGKCGVHPATKTFQALRIAVNDELNALEEALPQAAGLLEPHGRLAVISFHSLEDRIVKRAFQRFQNEGRGRVATKRPVTPSRREILANQRARSAKLRVFEHR